MGIYDREYYRVGGSGGGSWSAASMCQRLLIVTVVAYLLQFFLTAPRYLTVDELIQYSKPAERQALQQMRDQGHEAELERLVRQMGPIEANSSVLENWGAVDPYHVIKGQIWRLLTYAFLHSRQDQTHILFNMLALWMFGHAIEALMGRREFLAFYLISAIAAGLFHVLFGLLMKSPAPAVGASGAVMAISMLFALNYPRTPITLFFLFTIEARWLILLYIAMDLLPVLQALSGRADAYSRGVAHAAHLGGLGFGFLYFYYKWRLTDWSPGGSRASVRSLVKWWNRPAVKVYAPPLDQPTETPVPRPTRSRQELESRVDEILQKIMDQGEASLTPDEREILRDASEAYKRRNR